MTIIDLLWAEQMRQIDYQPAAIILEPIGRNTAPALTVAAIKALELHDDPLLVGVAVRSSYSGYRGFHCCRKPGPVFRRAGAIW